MAIKTDLWTMSNTLFLGWSNIKTLMDFRLGFLLGRPVDSQPIQDAEYWDVKTGPIAPNEMERLFQIGGADEQDKKEHSGDKLTWQSITAQFALKLVAAELPFPIVATVATENGVYFIGQDIPYAKIYDTQEETAYVRE